MPRPTKGGARAKPANRKKLRDSDLRAPTRGTVIERTFYTWDTAAPGLGLRTQTSGSRSFYVVYRHRHRRRTLYIGRAEIGLNVARGIAKGIVAEVANGRDPWAERKALEAAGTFEQLHADYLKRHARKHNKSWAQSDFLVRTYLLPAFGDKPAAEVTRADVRAVLGKVEDRPHLRTGIKAAASSVFSWALSEDIVPLNPCAGIKVAKSTERERVLEGDEFPKVWAAFDNAGSVKSAVLRTILLTACRPGEAEAMRFEHIRDGVWTQPGLPSKIWPGTKNGKTHEVFLSPEARRVIDEIYDGEWPESGYVYKSARGGHADIGDAMRKICGDLGIREKITAHDLRRSAGTLITGLGFSRESMDRILNHRAKGVGRIYDRNRYESENRAIWTALGRKVMELAEGHEESNVVPLSMKG